MNYPYKSNSDKMDVARNTSGNVVTKNISGGTLDMNICQKIGKIVTVCGRIHSINPSIIASQVFFKIAEGYRPTTVVYGSGSMVIDTMTGSQTVCPTITSDGSVSLVYSGSLKCSQVYFFSVYYIE